MRIILLGLVSLIIISCQSLTSTNSSLPIKGSNKASNDSCSGAIYHQYVSGRSGHTLSSWTSCNVVGGLIKMVASANGCCSTNNQTWPVSITFDKASEIAVLQINRYKFTATKNDHRFEIQRSDNGKELYFKFNVETRDDSGKYLRVKANSWFYVIDQ
ncbi:hypothetical protein [Kangiella sp. HZ709]|uniref:hypothetical protein n=1 Tax=Kangiella sp. HZ709 TaxID=2666328 RepID=UPI0012B09AAA|nr:hypothetical protein [Kangiella sp. HZ709]MRX28598.1 hypothetical protein [Kangiella sp. HZ709]